MYKFRLGLLSLLALGLLAGCNRSSYPAKVSGKVTYKGQPLKGGTVWFHWDTGRVSGLLSTEGTYEIVDIPAGNMTVTVENESLNPDKKAPAYPRSRGQGENQAEKMGVVISKQGTAGLYVKLPKKYSDPTTSDLKVTVEPGKQTRDFDLTD